MHTENPPFAVLVSGIFTPRQVKVRWRPDQPGVPDHLRQAMDDYWCQQVALTPRSSFIFNGELCSLAGFAHGRNRLTLSLARTNYQQLLYSNHIHEESRSGPAPEFRSRALGISAILLSSDDQIVLIKRSARVGESPGKLDVIGGHIGPDEHAIHGIPDPFFAIQEEIAEEIGLHPHSQLACIGLLETTITRKPEMLFLHQSTLPAAAILRTAANCKSDEIAEVLTIPNEQTDLTAMLQTRGHEFSPSALGCFSLYLQRLTETGRTS